jgi:hypothetical protein
MAIIPVFNYLSVVWQHLLKYLSDPGKLFISLVSAATAVRVEARFGAAGARSTRRETNRRRRPEFGFSRVCLIAPGKFVLAMFALLWDAPR